jgi:endogenous inhibitor of DNA gyrase (YacG/DUF329 family)
MTCPICGKEPADKYKPFCSRRCSDVDLGRWLKGSYVIPGPAVEDDSSSDAEGSPPSRPQ